MHICHDEPLLFRRKAEKRIIELSPCKVRLIRSDDLTSQAGGDRSALGRMDDFLSEKVQEHGIVRFGKKKRACNRLDYRLLLADRVGFEPTSRLRDYLISSLLCNCDGGARFGVVSETPVPAESRLKSGFFARKALQDGLLGKWVQIGIFPDFGEKCGKIGEKNWETAIHRRIELPTDENLFLRCYKWMYFPSTGTAFPR